jgi:hypothetical protein
MKEVYDMANSNIARRDFIIQSASALAILPLLVSDAVGSDKASGESDTLLSALADWQAQDYVDSSGILSVSLDPSLPRLSLVAYLVGQHPNYAKGEAYVDLRYFLGLEDKAGIDLSRSQITIQADVPEKFVGPSDNFNGAQVLVKDTQFRSQYGTWVNVTAPGKLTVSLRPTSATPPDGFTSPGFDPTQVRIVGIKFGIGSQSTATYEGPLYITGVAIDPPLPISPAIRLPTSVPSPLITNADQIELKTDGFYFNGKRWFLIGGSWRALEYGGNFGSNAWFPSGNGISKHPNFVRSNLDIMKRAGVKVARVGLLDDGRTMLDKEGHVTGYDDAFRNDVSVFLDLVLQAGLMAEFTFLDFHIAGRGEELDRVWLRGRSGIITDEALRREFTNDFVARFAREFGNHPALFCMELINEPEWLVSNQDGGGWDDRTDPTKPETAISGEVMRLFFTESIAAMRSAARSKFVTIGTSTKFFSLVKDLDIDYYAFHHYPFMGPLKHYIPLLPNEKPWSLEEYPTRIKPGDPTGVTPKTIKGWLKLVSSVGGAGAMLWNLTPEIDDYTFPFSERQAVLLQLRKWVNKHPF